MGETGSPEVDEIQAHLPEEPNSFVGRERELGELRRLLGRTRALTLCGPGGVGKTRLALRVTSREPLRVAAETIWRVPALSVAPPDANVAAGKAFRYEAVRRFADRAAASCPGFEVGPANAAAVISICRALAWCLASPDSEGSGAFRGSREQAAGDGWNEGYALGTQAAVAARLGRLQACAALRFTRSGSSWLCS
jgi:predicted ATPase